jgi:hypothetical protein
MSLLLTLLKFQSRCCFVLLSDERRESFLSFNSFVFIGSSRWSSIKASVTCGEDIYFFPRLMNFFHLDELKNRNVSRESDSLVFRATHTHTQQRTRLVVHSWKHQIPTRIHIGRVKSRRQIEGNMCSTRLDSTWCDNSVLTWNCQLNWSMNQWQRVIPSFDFFAVKIFIWSQVHPSASWMSRDVPRLVKQTACL